MRAHMYFFVSFCMGTLVGHGGLKDKCSFQAVSSDLALMLSRFPPSPSCFWGCSRASEAKEFVLRFMVGGLEAFVCKDSLVTLRLEGEQQGWKSDEATADRGKIGMGLGVGIGLRSHLAAEALAPLLKWPAMQQYCQDSESVEFLLILSICIDLLLLNTNINFKVM